MKVIEHDGVIFAKIIPFGDKNNVGTSFYTEDSDYIQFAIHQPEKNKSYASHYHLQSNRIVKQTQEVLIVLSGKLKASFFTKNKKLVAEQEIVEGHAVLLLNGAHGFDVLTDDCMFLEVKNGPYLGAETDRKQI